MSKQTDPKQGEKNEFHPHPVMEQLPGVQYCINSPPPWLEAVFLGFQHYIVTLGTIIFIPTILVPQMGGDDGEKAKVIQTLLFLSGLNTLTQSLFGTRLPSVVSGSHAFLISATSIIQAKRYKMDQEPHMRFENTMRGIQGALLITACFQMILGFLGLWRNIVKFLSPLSSVPLVSFTGLGFYYLAFPMLTKCIEIGLSELVLIVLISQYLPKYVTTKKPLCERFAVLSSASIVWACAGLLTLSNAYGDQSTDDVLTTCRTDRSGLIRRAPWIYIPLPLQWGAPTFNVGETFAMLVASFVTSVESTGTFLATARYGSATPVPPSVISRGIGWLGVGNFLGSMCGSVTGFTASVENAGSLALTKVGSRRVIQISAGFMIFFSIFGKFGAVFASIPLPIAAALYCIFFGCVSSAGLGQLQFCNLNSFRTKFILGLSFSLGLTIPQYFREFQLTHNFSPVHTHSRWFNDITSVIFMSHATVASMVALFLDYTLPLGGDDKSRKDSGAHWWEKFVIYNKDNRSDEFYKLPCQLNKYFPPL